MPTGTGCRSCRGCASRPSSRSRAASFFSPSTAAGRWRATPPSGSSSSMPGAPYSAPRPDFALASIVLLLGATTAVGCTHLLAILRTSLAERQRELSELSTRLMSVQEEERRRLSRELHDEFGQSLTAVNANLW